jgi:hypothetical protein
MAAHVIDEAEPAARVAAVPLAELFTIDIGDEAEPVHVNAFVIVLVCPPLNPMRTGPEATLKFVNVFAPVITTGDPPERPLTVSVP